MSKYLVVVESPAKAKTINKFLGSNYIVKACFGAVRDLPKSQMGVAIDDNFKPKYVALREERARKAMKAIKEAAEKVDGVLLASDPDREGEAIAWHVAEILKSTKKTADVPSTRIVFHEITKKSVREAVKNPREIDADLVDAQQARRVLDRLVGYKLSPLLGWVLRKGLSAGRVQSVAVRMVVDRENEILGFKPEEYWTLEANFLTERADPFTAHLHRHKDQAVRLGDAGHVANEESAKAIIASLEGVTYTIESLERKSVKRRPAPPFITSSLQQEASRKLGMSTAKTMAVAQQLYQGISLGKGGEVGLITYMRTDSLRLSSEALDEVRGYIRSKYSQEFLPERANFYRNKKNAQDAHEAIRPTEAMRSPQVMASFLSAEQLKLYTLIWQRFVACQMTPAILDQTSVDIRAGESVFRASGSVMKFAGFTTVYQESRDDSGEGNSKDRLLPVMNEGEESKLEKLIPEQHFTKPPARYSEAMLVRAMEENGIGRPSTYAPTIRTILDREYVTRENRRLAPTELGQEVNTWLVKHFPDVLSIDFTARLEDNLDEIEEGKLEWRKLVGMFYGPFENELKITEARMIAERVGDDPRCPLCDAPVALKQSWFGLYLGCTRHPDCKGTLKIQRSGPPPEETDEVCGECGSPMVIRTGRFGRFLACSAYPKCKVSFNLDKDGKKVIREPKEPPKKTDQKCTRCKKGMLVIRKNKSGEEFYGCETYPKCRFTKPMELNLPCPDCGGSLEHKMAKRRRFVGCGNYPKCDFTVSGKVDKSTPCPECGNGWTATVKPRGKPRVRRCPIKSCGFEAEIEEGEAA